MKHGFRENYKIWKTNEHRRRKQRCEVMIISHMDFGPSKLIKTLVSSGSH